MLNPHLPPYHPSSPSFAASLALPVCSHFVGLTDLFLYARAHTPPLAVLYFQEVYVNCSGAIDLPKVKHFKGSINPYIVIKWGQSTDALKEIKKVKF